MSQAGLDKTPLARLCELLLSFIPSGGVHETEIFDTMTAGGINAITFTPDALFRVNDSEHCFDWSLSLSWCKIRV